MNNQILIIDDNEKNISLMALLLTHAGYSVITANSGSKGVATAQSEAPALILMDIQMPEMDGFDAAHALFNNELTRNIPVIGISAYASPSTRERAIRMGMVGFFEKPINRESFVSGVRAFLPLQTA